MSVGVDTAIAPVRHRVVFAPSWRSFSSTQGGLLVGHLLAAAAEVGPGAPRVVTAHLLQGVATGVEVQVSASPDRRATTGSVRAQLRQEGVLCATAQVLTLDRDPSPRREPYPSPAAPGPLEGVPFELPTAYVPIGEHTEIRALGTSRPLAGGPEPRLHAWVRLRAPLPPLVQLGVLLDALPPSLFAARRAPVALPTVELTAHLAAGVPPTGAWVRIDQRTSWYDADLAVDDAQVHDEQGDLVATVRQTRRVLGEL